ncbi:MAG: hypothetical protein HY816_08410 [Candidatus Wallbacteria bacterium]|nr:hypothetical protein [Candidatus Wallbacteria bacterium]
MASAPDGLYLELRSGIVLWNEKAGRRQYVPDLRVQRSYLGIDASWMDRYMELLGILNKFLDEARKSRR